MSPCKFQLGIQVTFSGVNISHNNFIDAVCLALTDEKMKEIEVLRMPKSKMECQSLVGMINQLTSFIPKINHKLKHIQKMTSAITNFRETEDVKLEFKNLKKELKEQITLSPIDTGLPLHLSTDASTDGLSYFLYQEKELTDEESKQIVDDEGKKKIIKTVVHMGSNSLRDAQGRYSIMEPEVLCIQWACQKLH